MGLAEAFADVFVARDGDATMTDIAVVFAVIAAVIVGYWLMRRKHRRDWAHWRQRCEQRVTVNRQHLELLTDDEERLESIIQDIRARIIADWAPEVKPERHLKVL